MSILRNLLGRTSSEQPESCCTQGAAVSTCGCGGACDTASPAGEGVVVTVMGSGCKSCSQLHEHAVEAAKRIGNVARVEYVTDLAQIANAGVMTTPALLVDGRVVSAGKVLTVAEVEELLR